MPDRLSLATSIHWTRVWPETKSFASGQTAVQWLQIDRDNFTGKVLALPKREDVNLPVNEQLIVELYSK